MEYWDLDLALVYELNTLYVGLHLQLEKFTVSEMFEAFDMDGLTTSHPIYVPVESPDQINEIFDHIIYNKVRSEREIQLWFTLKSWIGWPVLYLLNLQPRQYLSQFF